MKHITLLVSQRTVIEEKYGEVRDALDQRWHKFFSENSITPILIPNHRFIAQRLTEHFVYDGILLTGGNDSPSREEVETLLINCSKNKRIPLLGVCHGMQAIQRHFGVKTYIVEGHVTPSISIEINGAPASVNSYHNEGTHHTITELQVWARAADGVVKAIRHASLPMTGIMWHPERCAPYEARDVTLFNNIFRDRQ